MIEYFFLLSLGTPFIWIILLGMCFFASLNVQERLLSEAVKFFSILMATINTILFVLVWLKSPDALILNYGNWIQVGHYDFKIRFYADLIGAAYALLSSLLIGIIFKFSRNYLHKEQGYFRFVFLLSILLFGLTLVSYARSLDLLFAGWELVGTTSVLLIGYFYSQVQPVRHAFKAIVSYRLCDMGILAAAAWAHHYLHSTDYVVLGKLQHHAGGSGLPMMMVGVFVIWASLAKAGQLPMSSWLPTAMEGPTPSSAIFYGALSVHLGPFLLLRFHDYIEHFPILLWAIGIIGGLSAIYASLVGRTRPDAKTMLAYATISQVGIIYIEIALGFTNFALFHMVAHASMRTYQFLRSSSLIQDFFENPVVQQNALIKRRFSLETFIPPQKRRSIFIHALHGFHLDFFTRKLVDFFMLPAKTFICFERKWMDWDNRILRLLLKRKGQ